MEPVSGSKDEEGLMQTILQREVTIVGQSTTTWDLVLGEEAKPLECIDDVLLVHEQDSPGRTDLLYISNQWLSGGEWIRQWRFTSDGDES